MQLSNFWLYLWSSKGRSQCAIAAELEHCAFICSGQVSIVLEVRPERSVVDDDRRDGLGLEIEKFRCCRRLLLSIWILGFVGEMTTRQVPAQFIPVCHGPRACWSVLLWGSCSTCNFAVSSITFRPSDNIPWTSFSLWPFTIPTAGQFLGPRIISDCFSQM